MALAVTYTNFGGQIVHEDRNSTERAYVPDTLGSTIALVDSTGSITDSWNYWPYGETASSSGNSNTPFKFVGTLGYSEDSSSGLTYVRARHYNTAYGGWQTLDPLWPNSDPYSYAFGAPNYLVDPTGLRSPACLIPCAPCLACLIDLLIVCPPGDGFFECATEVIKHLPPWAKWLCGLACGGCLACLALPPRPVPGPVGGGPKPLPGPVGGGPKPLPGPRPIPRPKPIIRPRPRPNPKALPIKIGPGSPAPIYPAVPIVVQWLLKFWACTGPACMPGCLIACNLTSIIVPAHDTNSCEPLCAGICAGA